ncbi:MAG TPA: beta-galactosidase [Verrucomicrobiota bacterium]|nr:beta-galactosidase [Verrucomicrobiota bacterium]HNT14655.1 beta-galactosidase [Verrucomicrobiota bacterium]
MNAHKILVPLLLGLATAPVPSAAGKVLLRPDSQTDLTKFVTTDAVLERAGSAPASALRLITGIRQRWPGVTLPAPDGHWDLSPFANVIVAVRNTGTNRATLNCRVDNPGADGRLNCVNGAITLNPGENGSLRVLLRRASGDTLDGKLFGLRGYPVVLGGPETIKPNHITQILLFVSEPQAPHQFDILSVSATGDYTPPTAWVTDADPFFPFIDLFGQYKHKDWPGKVHSLAELQQRRETEARELAAQRGPGNWDQYGGWADGPKLEATGFFRTAKHNGKWWLVDPEGHLFFSHGIDCVLAIDVTPIAERASWFEDFPGDQEPFRRFRTKAYALKGHYADRSPECFPFASVNLQRKYGPDWRAVYTEVIHQRLRSWGLNTIANWSAGDVFLKRRTPYTDNVGSHGARMIEGSEGYWGKFPDVFDASFANSLRRAMAGKRKTSANDPWCLGYFSDNEMSWGDETSLALAALKSPADQPAKLALLADLKAKYAEIEKLNQVWGTTHDSWDALLATRETPDAYKARADLTAFYSHTAETYFRVVREAIKAVAPQQLYLGCRFAWVNRLADLAAGKYCDVISYNLYERSVADFKNPSHDKPLIIGEFHFGALDRGLFHTGLVPVENQAARATSYKEYVLGALRHPQFVGTHWFQYMDEPTTGRVYDEENYQIGFVDIADTPYAETIAASREVGRQLYDQP